MTNKNDKPVMYNGEFVLLTSGAKRIVNKEGAQKLADRYAARNNSLINPTGHVRDEGQHYTVFVKGGIHG